MSEARLVRTAFKTSRFLDFASKRELVAQVGHEVEDWPLVVLKELVDNAIDACEEAEIAPEIEVSVSTERSEIVVADNGPGIPAKVIKDILDFGVRVSSREAYVSPTRGAQGNAAKVVVCMGFALAQENAGETIIETRGTAHRIAFAVDPVRQAPKISHETAPSIVKKGTCVTVRWPRTACSLLEKAEGRFLQMARAFGLFNPHLALALTWNGQELVKISSTNPAWQKWSGCDPTSAHWYDRARLERIMAAHVANDLDHKRERTAREFIAEFRGLSGSVKPAAVLDEAELGRPSLASFFADGAANHTAIARLLHAMKANSRPVKPEQVGIIGSDHLAAHLIRDDADLVNFRYKRVAGEHHDIPYVVEAAFVSYSDDRRPRIITGVNWSGAINQPFRFQWRRLGEILASRSIYESSPVAVAVHFACPRPEFTDRGKSTIAIPFSTEDSFLEALNYVTAHWARSEKAQEREEERERRESEKRVAAAAKAAAAAPKRPKNEIVGSGALHHELAAAAVASKLAIKNLTVLSPQNDPYWFDTKVGHENGQWFKDQVERLVGPTGQVHLRGLLYRLVAAGNIKKPAGEVFINTDDNWKWLIKHAAKAARWLGYVPFNRISDERNAPPQLFLPESLPGSGHGSFVCGLPIQIPLFDTLLPGLAAIAPRGAQPYRIVLIGEKSSLADVLAPVARRVHGELLLPTGESTETMIAEMAARAAADGRPAIVLYFSDFDPSGWQMPISVARKLQGLRTLLYPNLQIDVRRVALTLEHVRQYDLPSTPLKATEKRKSRWRQVMGHEQTEIDALAALRPDDLREIALAAVAPFYDFTLAARCNAAAEAWRVEARKKLDHPDVAVMQDKLSAAYDLVNKTISDLHTVQSDTYGELRRKLGIADVSIAAPEAQIKETAPSPMFTTADDFATASIKLIAEKKYEDIEDEELMSEHTTLTAPPAARAAIASRLAEAAPKTVHHVPLRSGGLLRLSAKAIKVSLVATWRPVRGCGRSPTSCAGSHRRGPTRTRMLSRSPPWCTSCAGSRGTLDPSAVAGVGRDQAGIDGKAFATDQALVDTALQHRLEQPAQQVAVAETAMPVLREGRVVRHRAVEA